MPFAFGFLAFTLGSDKEFLRTESKLVDCFLLGPASRFDEYFLFGPILSSVIGLLFEPELLGMLFLLVPVFRLIECQLSKFRSNSDEIILKFYELGISCLSSQSEGAGR